MSLNNFDFPSVTLRQEYAEATTGTRATLGVACIGQRYSFYTGDSAVALYNGSSYNGGSLPATFIDGKSTIPTRLNETIDNSDDSAKLLVKGARIQYATLWNSAAATDDSSWSTYKYEADSSYSANSDVCQFTVSSDTTGFEVSIVFGKSMISDQQIYLKNGGGKVASELFTKRGLEVGDKVRVFVVENEEEVSGEVIDISATSDGYNKVTVKLNWETIPSAAFTLASIDFLAVADIELDDSNFTLSTTNKTLTVSAGITVDLDGDGIVETTAKLVGCDAMSLSFRCTTTAGKHELGVVESLADIQEALGPVEKANPLALACYFALSAGNSTPVYYTVVASDDDDDYIDACDFLDKYDGIYSIVPCTTTAAVIQAVTSACESVSNNEESRIRRVCWYGVDNPTEIELAKTKVSGAPTLVETGKYSITLADPVFYDNIPKEGDVLRLANDKELPIIATSGSSVCTVTAESTDVPAASAAISYVRVQPEAADIIKYIIEKRKALTTSERAMCVWGDGLAFGGEKNLPNFALAAAAAGMRAYEPFQRPISNLGYSFFSLAEPYGMTRSQLKQLGREGIWIIANNQDGTPINMRQLTTAVANNLNKDEESIIAIADTVAMSVITIGQQWVGCSNISPDMLILLRSTLDGRLESFTFNETGDPLIGAPLLSYEIVSLEQDSVNLDRVYAVFNVEPPKPFNKFQMTMRVI